MRMIKKYPNKHLKKYISPKERQKITDNLDLTILVLARQYTKSTTKFRTKNLVETNDESRATCNKNNQIIFKTSMLRSNLCDYSDAYILVKRTITVEK